MASDRDTHDNSPRWRPRFSARTLVVIVTLVCAYAACLRATKRQGVEDVTQYIVIDTEEEWGADAADALRRMNTFGATANVPFVVDVPAILLLDGRRYYFWFFGYVAKLPYEREL